MPSQDWQNWQQLHKPRRSLGRFAWRWPVLALALSLAGLAYTSRYWQPLLVSWRLQQKLDSATDDEAAVLLRQALEFGPSGMASVVEQLDARRNVIRSEALRTLANEIDSWPGRPPEQAARRSAQLADALSKRIESLGPLSRSHAMRLARDILQFSATQPAEQRAPLVAACRHVLAVAARRGDAFDPTGMLADADFRHAGEGADDSTASSHDTQRGSGSDGYLPGESDLLNDVASLPGGGIPFGPLPGPRLSPDEERLAQAGESAAPPLLEIQEPVRPLQMAPGHARRDGSSPNSAEAALAGGAADEPPAPPAGLDSRPSEDTDPNEPSDVTKLLNLLHDVDAGIAADARRKLVQRGFTPGQIEIGTHLTAADPRERRRWTEMLPRYVGIETKPWLLWMSHDADADVRLAAASLMATTGDPQMLERVQQLARDDDDARVREAAQRMTGREAAAERR